jgi:hypothetical protein
MLILVMVTDAQVSAFTKHGLSPIWPSVFRWAYLLWVNTLNVNGGDGVDDADALFFRLNVT